MGIFPDPGHGRAREEVAPMDQLDGLTHIQQRARLHGPHETRRAVRAVLEALAEIIPFPVLYRLVARLPHEIRPRLPQAAIADHDRPATGCRDFIKGIARRLFIEEPDAAFLARVVFEQLNTNSHGLTPSTIASLAPHDLRPLLNSRSPHPSSDPARTRHRTAPAIIIPSPRRAARPSHPHRTRQGGASRRSATTGPA
ncbi:DUF2267 domain-containing protein [Actinoplanes sp. NPDC051346]|uniref:DUF2267 domain-containing protein n=1 Tax=Actinoplanes sp. NPDC051346 TaxID=3155048 RepID=UPI00342DE06E